MKSRTGYECFTEILFPHERRYFEKHGYLWIRFHAHPVWALLGFPDDSDISDIMTVHSENWPLFLVGNAAAANLRIKNVVGKHEFFLMSSCIEKALPPHDVLTQIYLYAKSVPTFRDGRTCYEPYFFKKMANHFPPEPENWMTSIVVKLLLKQENTWRKLRDGTKLKITTDVQWRGLNKFLLKAKGRNSKITVWRG